MAVKERDPHTGHATTGHEWNGIKELNTPVPRAVFFFLAIAAIVSLVYWILMPAWPWGTSYTKGVLHVDQRKSVNMVLQRAATDRKFWVEQIGAKPIKEIQADPALMRHVRQTGPALFGDNCAACHGRDAKGGPGFPNLTTSSAWLWGGDADTIAETIRVGINASHRSSRISQMPGFAAMLPAAEIDDVVTYVESLSYSVLAKSPRNEAVVRGKVSFVANCASCHGNDAKGDRNAGVPNLTDRFWIYGGDREAIMTTVWSGRQGQMPAWESRLSPIDRKILVLYLLDRKEKQ